jgi:hypothetical protein
MSQTILATRNRLPFTGEDGDAVPGSPAQRRRAHRGSLGRRQLTLLMSKVATGTAVLRTSYGGPRSSIYALRSQSD